MTLKTWGLCKCSMYNCMHSMMYMHIRLFVASLRMHVHRSSRHFTRVGYRVYMWSFTVQAQRINNHILFPEFPLGQLLFNWRWYPVSHGFKCWLHLRILPFCARISKPLHFVSVHTFAQVSPAHSLATSKSLLCTLLSLFMSLFQISS